MNVGGAVDTRHIPTDAAAARFDVVHDVNALRSRDQYRSLLHDDPTHLITLGV